MVAATPRSKAALQRRVCGNGVNVHEDRTASAYEGLVVDQTTGEQARPRRPRARIEPWNSPAGGGEQVQKMPAELADARLHTLARINYQQEINILRFHLGRRLTIESESLPGPRLHIGFDEAVLPENRLLPIRFSPSLKRREADALSHLRKQLFEIDGRQAVTAVDRLDLRTVH